MSDRAPAATPHRHEPPRFSLIAAAVATAMWLAACSSTPPADTDAPDADEPTATAPAPVPTPAAPGTPPPPFIPVSPTPQQPGAGASPPPPSMPLPSTARFVRNSWTSLPGWQTDELSEAWPALLRNCDAVVARQSRVPALAAPAWVATRAWVPVCAAAQELNRRGTPSDAQVRQFIESRMDPWVVGHPQRNEAVTGLVTGYYEPLVQASRVRGGQFQWPMYATPDDLLVIDLGSVYPELTGKRVRGKLVGKRVVPYDTRAEIESGGKQLPALVWVNDPVDAFFLQVQGSGRAELIDGPDRGRTIRLAYAEHNGQPYVSIGKWLVDQGQLTLAQASMQNIRAWARSYPHRTREMLNANPAMVFFREEAVNGDEGPKGAFGVPLTPQRSIAVDPAIVPLGAPVFLSTTQPNSNQPLNHLVFAQDTGTAIRGAARADLFWGYGAAAGEIAGRAKQPGKMWVLWPKNAGAPQSAR